MFGLLPIFLSFLAMTRTWILSIENVLGQDVVVF